MASGMMCYAEDSLADHNAPQMSMASNSAAGSATMRLPFSTPAEANEFLGGIGGDAVGAGYAMNRAGISIPQIRTLYKQRIKEMVAELSRRSELGESAESLARWVSAERTKIAQEIRQMGSPGSQTLYNIRDTWEYGRGGRTWENIERRYSTRGLSGPDMHNHIISGAMRSNVRVDEASLRGARFLKHGGRVVVVVGIGLSAARIWNASDHELPRVIGEELGGLAGGAIGASVAVGACIVFGVATGGWGLLACGIIGGAGGGYLGSSLGGEAADALYYTDTATPDQMMGEITIEIPADRLYSTPPLNMCTAPF